jgi:transposase InsO family protein
VNDNNATFADSEQAQQACKEAIALYNTRHPHRSLGFQTPDEVHRVTGMKSTTNEKINK